MYKNSFSKFVILHALAVLVQDMVMMGQQYLDTERKNIEEDDDYSHPINPQDRSNHQLAHIVNNNMARREIPTLKTLAERSRRKLTESDREKGGSAVDNEISQDDEGNTKKLKSEVIPINGSGGSGDGPEEQQFRSKEISATSASASTINGVAESSSGRTSSLGGGDTSGMGTSLTSSASSEPMERDALSPSSENGGNGDSAEAEDVPANNSNSSDNSDVCVEGSSSNSSVNESQEAESSSSTCKALVLAEDFNGNSNMTAAKQFLQMVRIRSGVKGDESSPLTSTITTGKNGNGNPTTGAGGADSSMHNNIKKTNYNNNGTPGRPANAQLLYASNGIRFPNPSSECIKDVWANNLIEEFAKIRQIVKRYNFIAMDSEFPGVIFRPQSGRSGAAGVFPYQLLKSNVDHLKIIQLGVTFMDKEGRMPPGTCTWQFNFSFNLSNDMYAEDSISLLQRCGLQFQKHSEMGIDPQLFGEYFMSSGMVTTDEVTYLTFHSGFDFGYLMKLLSSAPLPSTEEMFFDLMKLYFPNVYDLKFLMKSVDLHGGLQDIANQVGQERIGIQHQAGSDSLLTGMSFFRLLHSEVFNGEIDSSKYNGKLYGFQMTATDKDEGLIPKEILNTTSPKPAHRISNSSSTSNHNCNNVSNNNPPPISATAIPLPYQQHSPPMSSSNTNNISAGDNSNNNSNSR